MKLESWHESTYSSNMVFTYWHCNQITKESLDDKLDPDRARYDLQWDITDSNIDRIKDRKEEHCQVFSIAKLSRCENTSFPKHIGTNGTTKSVNGSQGPWKGELKDGQDDLVV